MDLHNCALLPSKKQQPTKGLAVMIWTDSHNCGRGANIATTYRNLTSGDKGLSQKESLPVRDTEYN